MSCFHVFCLLFCKDSKNVCNPADSTQFFCNFLSKILTKTCLEKVMKESRIQINNATNVLKK